MIMKSALLALLASFPLSTGCEHYSQESEEVQISEEKQELFGHNKRHNKRLAMQLFEDVFNGKDLDAADDLIAQDYIQHNPFVGPGLSGFKDFFEGFLQAVPDLHVEVLQVIAERNRVVVYSQMTGTYTGDFAGVAVNERSIDLLVADIWRVEAGKLAEHWDVFDNLAFQTQLGLLPSPE